MTSKALLVPVVCKCGNKWKQRINITVEEKGMGFFTTHQKIREILKNNDIRCPACNSTSGHSINLKDFFRERQ